ncbi:hypothetical protein [Entomohabitans teleogrylli]|uniref:hypothetical protein n=1 Tax=Entomohabitans teleogrylli TaxID=1384589 RepID=UPI0012B6AAC8|nr:hypothetical protein [Entomohabitans teleogrylli]
MRDIAFFHCTISDQQKNQINESRQRKRPGVLLSAVAARQYSYCNLPGYFPYFHGPGRDGVIISATLFMQMPSFNTDVLR